ncbi:MAG: glycosyltransferase family 4 protein [Elusimicrobiales bacterium]
MKVLIVTERFYPEEFLVNELAAAWTAAGDSVEVLTQAPSYPAGRIFPGYSNSFFSSETWKGVRISRFFTVTGYRDSLFFKLLNYLSFAVTGTAAALLRARGKDRIFVYQTGPLTLAIPAVLAGRLYGIPVSIWTQDIWPDMVYSYGFRKTRGLDWLLSLIIRFVYSNCAGILVSCEGFAGRISEYVPGRQIAYFPNWPAVFDDGGAERAPLPEGFNVTFAGNVGKLQNLENILRGFALAVKKQPELRLNIVGDGSHLEALKAIAKAERVPGVTFWGRHQVHEMPAFFRASDVMIVSLANTPGLNLVVPSKFQAYLAFHKPVFAVMNGAVKDLVARHGIGLSADPDSPEAIRDVFLEFYFRKLGGTGTFAANARRLLETEYDMEQIISGIRSRVAAGK